MNGLKYRLSFSNSGKYSITLAIKDDSKQANAVDYDNVVIHVNQSPHIITNGYYEIAKGQTINFDASKSFDEDGDIKSFSCYLNDNIISRKSRFKYKFEKAGKFKIQLFISDNSGVSNSQSKKNIEVFVNSKPVSNTIANVYSCSNLISVSASNAYDPDNDELGFTWNLGDGDNAEGVKLFHSYMRAGTYTVRLTVSDNRNCRCSTATAKKIIKIISRETRK